MNATSPESNSQDNSNQNWLNRIVVGMGLTSLLADASYEMANAVLPSFLEVIGVTAALNGIGDFVASTLTGFLWTALSPVVAFACAGFLVLAGAGVVYRVR